MDREEKVGRPGGAVTGALGSSSEPGPTQPMLSLGGILVRHVLSAKRVLGAKGDREDGQRGFN